MLIAQVEVGGGGWGGWCGWGGEEGGGGGSSRLLELVVAGAPGHSPIHLLAGAASTGFLQSSRSVGWFRSGLPCLPVVALFNLHCQMLGGISCRRTRVVERGLCWIFMVLRSHSTLPMSGIEMSIAQRCPFLGMCGNVFFLAKPKGEVFHVAVVVGLMVECQVSWECVPSACGSHS